MSTKPVKVLLVEDSPVHTIMMEAILAKAGASQTFLQNVELACAGTLSAGISRLGEGDIDVVLLDLNLPDANGIETLGKVREQGLDIPVVVLTGHNDEQLAVEAMRMGAQDYLVKEQVNYQLLVRALRYALERHQLLRSMSLIDELTGLYNRRGFLTIGEQYLRLARRSQNDCLLVYADMDGLKQINDSLGHQEGSMALVRTGEVLRESFRGSDVLARLGGDEFTALAADTDENGAEVIAARLRENLNRFNLARSVPYELSLSVGMARFEHESNLSLGELIAMADHEMYKQKRSKRLMAEAVLTEAASSSGQPARGRQERV